MNLNELSRGCVGTQDGGIEVLVNIGIQANGKWYAFDNQACVSVFRSSIAGVLEWRHDVDSAVVTGVSLNIEADALNYPAARPFVDYICKTHQYGGYPVYDHRKRTLYFHGEHIDVNLFASAARAFINIREFPVQCFLFHELVKHGVDEHKAFIIAGQFGYVYDYELVLKGNNGHDGVHRLSVDRDERASQFKQWKDKRADKDKPINGNGYSGICSYAYPSSENGRIAGRFSFQDAINLANC